MSMIGRRCIVVAAGLCAVVYSGAAAAFKLLTKDEMRRAARGTPPPDEGLKRRIDVKAPVITLKHPDTSRPVRSPVNIELAFQANPDAQIEPSTFRARYLFLDLTDKIKKHGTIGPDGVRVLNAELPNGSFRIVFEVADTLRRVGKLEVNVEIAQ
jgi:hypothetical protein